MNLIHNILNVVILLCGVLAAPEFVALLPPELAVKIVGVSATAKLALNGMRDGLKGFYASQPPIK